MKSFIDICKMTQKKVKKYAEKELRENGYEPINEDGFLYAKGTYPVLLVAHMDTVHKQCVKTIVRKKGNIVSSPQGIGGDDRCGIYMILNIIQKYHCSVLFTEDEEIGCVGARKFSDTKYVKNLDVNYMIELDRRGSKDAVFYSNGNKDFQEWICDKEIGFEKDTGSYSDICEIMETSGIAGVNLSCGYYKEHTLEEYVKIDEMETNINRVFKIIARECKEPWEYVCSHKGLFGYGYIEEEYWDLGYNVTENIQRDEDIFDEKHLIVMRFYYSTLSGFEGAGCGVGITEQSCLGDFLLRYTGVSVSDIYETEIVVSVNEVKP